MRTKLSFSLFAACTFMLSFGSATFASAEQTLQNTSVNKMQFPLYDALVNYRKVHHENKVSAVTLSHNQQSLAWTEDPEIHVKFEGSDATIVTGHYTNFYNGTPVATTTDLDYFSPQTHMRIASLVTTKSKRGSDSRYSIVTSNMLPKTAKIGDSGPFEQITSYKDSSKAILLDHSTTFWSLRADPHAPTGAILCVTDKVSPAIPTDVSQLVQECYHEDVAGDLTNPVEVSQLTTVMH